MFYIFITSVSLDKWATFLPLPAGCRGKGRVIAHHHLTCRCDSQIERKKGGKGVYFFISSWFIPYFSVKGKMCPLTVTGMVSSVKKDTHLSCHSHGSVLHSVLTSTSRFWLNRGINSSETELPKTLSAVWLQQVPVTASLVSAAVVAAGGRSTLQGSPQPNHTRSS